MTAEFGKIYTYCATKARANCYILEYNEIMIVIDPNVDPSILEIDHKKRMIILITHGHFDHVQKLYEWQRTYTNMQVLMHYKDLDVLKSANKYSLILDRTKMSEPIYSEIDFLLDDYNVLDEINMEYIRLPGHTDGSTIFVDRTNKLLFIGDSCLKSLTEKKQKNHQYVEQNKILIQQRFQGFTIYPGHGSIKLA